MKDAARAHHRWIGHHNNNAVPRCDAHCFLAKLICIYTGTIVWEEAKGIVFRRAGRSGNGIT